MTATLRSYSTLAGVPGHGNSTPLCRKEQGPTEASVLAQRSLVGGCPPPPLAHLFLDPRLEGRSQWGVSSLRAEAWDLHAASSQRCCCLCNWARPDARSPREAFPKACASELPGLQNVLVHAQGGWKGAV